MSRRFYIVDGCGHSTFGERNPSGTSRFGMSREENERRNREWLNFDLARRTVHAERGRRDDDLNAVNDICRVLMWEFAKVGVRFTPYNLVHLFDYRVSGRPRWHPPWRKEWKSGVWLAAIRYMWIQGWVVPAIWAKDPYEICHFRFTKEGITRWEQVERPKFEVTSDKFLRRQLDRAWDAATREDVKHSARLDEERRQRMIARFGVPWDVHETLREDGAVEWDE